MQFWSKSFTGRYDADLDRTNVNNAYVSGMKEELNMYGNEFNVSSDFPSVIMRKKAYLDPM